MKKFLLSVAILAVAASCSKNEVTDVVVPSQDAIGFATLNNLTRSANDDDQQYMVYAAQEDVAGAWYINGDYSTTDGDALQNTYYWPTDESTLDFYAYAPYTAGTPSVTPSTVISIAYTVPDTADEDFTIATPITGLTSTSDAYTTTGAVAFKFAHQLSKATVAVVLHADLVKAGYTLTMDEKVEAADAVYVDNTLQGEELTAESNIETPAVEAQDAATVTLGVFGKTATYDVMGNIAIDYGTIPDVLTTYKTDYLTTTTTGEGEDEETETTANYFIFMPQAEAEGCTIYVTGVTIKDPSQKVIAKSIALGTYTITDDDLESFDENTYYAITLTIDEDTVTDEPEDIFGDAIVFSAEKIGWEEDTLSLGSGNQASTEDDGDGDLI